MANGKPIQLSCSTMTPSRRLKDAPGAHVHSMKRLLVLLFLLASPAWASTRYVAPNCSGMPTPCTTTVSAAVDSGATGDSIIVTSGIGNSTPATYSNDVMTIGTTRNNLVIHGVGMNWEFPPAKGNMPKMDCNGTVSGQKAIFNVDPNVSINIEGLEMQDALGDALGLPNTNYAAIRINNASTGSVRVLYNVIHDNDNGVLGACDSTFIMHNEFYSNGSRQSDHGGAGQDHNVYIVSTGAKYVLFAYNYSHNTHTGHLFKSRAKENYILYNRLWDDNDSTTSAIDLPDCGKSYVIGNVMVQDPGTDNPRIVGYGLEGCTNPTKELYAFNNTIVNNRTDANVNCFEIVSGTTAQIRNNIFYWVATPGFTTAIYSGSSPTLSNNYTEQPQADGARFANAGAGDYHLTGMSPSTIIDAGMNPGTVSGFDCTPNKQYVYDRSFATRTMTGPSWDIGAFEYTAAGGSGGCPFVLTETGSGFSVENSILGRSEDGRRGRFVSDAYPLLARADSRGRIRLRIAELETETDEIDELKLGRVEVPAGDRLATDSSGRPVLMHQLEIPIQSAQWSGRQLPFQSPVAPGEAFWGEAGDSVEFDLQPGQSVAIDSRLGVGVQLRAKQHAPSLPASLQGVASGITIRVSPDAEGERWITLGSVIPREFWSADILPSTGPAGQEVRRIRVIWHTSHTLGWIGLVETAEVQPQILPCLMARHSAGGSVLGELNARDGRIATIRPEEFVELEFDAGEASTGTQYVLLANGRYYRTETQKSTAVPAAYGLAQNRPNPFNPETSIEFDLPKPSSVTLRVYSAAGQLIRTIVDKEMPAGSHTARWNARDDRGTPLPSGVYFYELRAGTFEQKRRMILLR